MIVLDSEQIDKLIDRNEMMDQIEEASRGNHTDGTNTD